MEHSGGLSRQQALLLWDGGNLAPLPVLPPPVPTALIPPSTPLQIARVYVPGCPVNFLSRVHRYADISGINLLLRIVMPMQMYTRFLSVFIFLLCVWVLVHTGNIPLCLCGQHRQGQDWHLGQVEAKLSRWGPRSGQQIGCSRISTWYCDCCLLLLCMMTMWTVITEPVAYKGYMDTEWCNAVQPTRCETPGGWRTF